MHNLKRSSFVSIEKAAAIIPPTGAVTLSFWDAGDSLPIISLSFNNGTLFKKSTFLGPCGEDVFLSPNNSFWYHRDWALTSDGLVDIYSICSKVNPSTTRIVSGNAFEKAKACFKRRNTEALKAPQCGFKRVGLSRLFGRYQLVTYGK